ncbi:MAG TPA: chromate resistance protein ChrB domain-containing protein [Burkholderiales bacterium]|nr:chromate resistance protein ChrB domain-containing protein [Burkholderiales bacterium]
MNAAAQWLLLIAQLPTEDPAARMRVLRTLESLGAAVIREGAYLLPRSASNLQALEALADYAGKIAGSAHVVEVSGTSAGQQAAFAALFDRTARYEALAKTVESLRISFGHSDPSAISRVLHKQRREFDAIAALDFFPTGAQARTRKALAEADAEVRRLLFPNQGKSSIDTTQSMLRRTWATRRPLWADRLASAWLIRRFIDPEATIVWLEKGDAAPKEAVSFAYEGATFANSAQGVTYENLLGRFDLARNAALGKIGKIVHYLEIHDAPVAEAAGVQTLLQGAMRRSQNDTQLLLEAEKAFDLLYEGYGS